MTRQTLPLHMREPKHEKSFELITRYGHNIYSNLDEICEYIIKNNIESYTVLCGDSTDLTTIVHTMLEKISRVGISVCSDGSAVTQYVAGSPNLPHIG